MEKKATADAREYDNNRFTKRVLYKQGDNVVFMLNFMPGQELPTHNHPGADVYILVLDGGGSMISNGEATEVTAGDAIRVSGEEMFSFRNTGAIPASLYVVLSKIPSDEYARNV